MPKPSHNGAVAVACEHSGGEAATARCSAGSGMVREKRARQRSENAGERGRAAASCGFVARVVLTVGAGASVRSRRGTGSDAAKPD